ncbi:3-oxoacyl-ACP reductase FabG [Pseudomonas cavernicola]|uniref:3-oxoacyl-ACP reductase FabG n=1 Tax=Pseudomonas cavernicola TaxID=2320866 RepID=A0A418X959_9PSED|nr:3-oxoacyl-ACP reductase FabG [Pseudomonas cavernicola]RJG09017.1 3-oxoacyl-ACP reductase FabG [Pseudomonas cavernicola]
MFTALDGKSIIVTGASKGIGRGIAKKFASKGGKVMVAARSERELHDLVEEITRAGGIAKATVCDVSDWGSVQYLVEETIKAFGGVDVLCANAGIYPQAHIAELQPEDWDHVMSTNLKSTFLCVKACLPQFEQRAGGRVVITSSITGPITGFPGLSHYSASKAGQLGFMRSAAIELARHNATINAVMPGTINTEGFAELGQEYADSATAGIPLQRIGSVDDIANAALFFASSEASYITGQTIVVDGGQILPEAAGLITAA